MTRPSTDLTFEQGLLAALRIMEAADRDRAEHYERRAEQLRAEARHAEAAAAVYRRRVEGLAHLIGYAEQSNVAGVTVEIVDPVDALEDVELAACRICGCTESAPCDGGCQWVADPAGMGDMCSSCEPIAAAAQDLEIGTRPSGRDAAGGPS